METFRLDKRIEDWNPLKKRGRKFTRLNHIIQIGDKTMTDIINTSDLAVRSIRKTKEW